MIFSYHETKKNFDASTVANHWKTYIGWEHLKRAVLKVPVSGCIWSDGTRAKDKFLFSDLLFLDFDDGLTIKEIKTVVEDTPHIITTTKSHQIEKAGKPACDRFRLIVPWEHRIQSKKDYEYSVSKHVAMLGCDRSCVDAGRFFFPGKEIVSQLDPYDNCLYADVYKWVPPKRKSWKPRNIQSNGMSRTIKMFLEEGRVFGSGRNESCYVTAKELKRLGYSSNEASGLIGGAPFDQKTKFKHNEIETVIRSAFK